MAQTPNFDITEVAANQNQKEVTINTGFVELEAAVSSYLAISMPDADYTLTTGEGGQALGHVAFQFSGFITADRNIIVPVNKKLYLVMNNTSTSLGFNLTVKTPSGTGVSIAPDNARYTLVYCDGTNVVAASQPSGAGSGTVTNNEGSLTANEVVIGQGGADVAVLGSVGTASQVLTSQGPGLPPVWAAGGGSGGGGSTPQTKRFQQDYVNQYNGGSTGLDGPADAGTMGTFFGKVNANASHGFIEKRIPGGAGSLAGFFMNAGFNYFYMGKNLGMFADVMADRITDCRHWVGLCESGGPDTAFGGSDNPAQNYIAFRFSTGAGDTNYQAICHDGSSATIVDTGIPGDTSSHRFAIVCDDTGASVKFYIDGNLVATITTHIPGAGTAFLWFAGATYISSSGVTSGTSAISLFSDF